MAAGAMVTVIKTNVWSDLQWRQQWWTCTHTTFGKLRKTSKRAKSAWISSGSKYDKNHRNKIILEQVTNYCYDHSSLGNLALYVDQPFTIKDEKYFPDFGNVVNGVVKAFKGDQGHVLSILRDSNDELFVCYRTSRYAKTRGEAKQFLSSPLGIFWFF